MLPDRRNRRPEKVTADLLVKRLRAEQLLLLVGQSEYADYQEEILAKLQGMNGFSLSNFRKVHKSGGCEIIEAETGKKIGVTYRDFELGSGRDEVPEKKLKCNGHGSSSTAYIKWESNEYEVRDLRNR